MAKPILDVDVLSIDYRTPEDTLHAVRDLSFAIQAGEAVGFVGESGSGKSTVAYAVMRYLAPNARFAAGAVRFQGDDLLSLDPESLRRLRGRRIAMVYQDVDRRGVKVPFGAPTSYKHSVCCRDLAADRQGGAPAALDGRAEAGVLPHWGDAAVVAPKR